ncbi:cyclin-domain-containing protein [Staphylotrichum tortipilum]|uniref:Cyclin-domain-containing protein n=1 Tax=Staphylotrichum tortipilum TaxID=2831512 RepID=A0AAN6RQM6_9PEZI|nr:cyclin-domain-containing protein [Staphylotrichum longicolle]
MAEGESTSGHGAGNGSDTGSVPSPPPPPVPAADPRLQHEANADHQLASPTLAAQVDDIFKISPLAALRLLSAGIEALVEMTGDIPPTPPPKSPAIPHLKGMEEEKKSIVRSNSGKNLALLAQGRASASNSPRPPRSPLQKVQSSSEMSPSSSSSAQAAAQDIDGVRLRTPNPSQQTQQPSPPAEHPPAQATLVPYIIVGDNSQPLNLQHSAITRKFYCRTPPPISITDYLLRIHNYCPMSTGVYLATSLYMHRLAVSERAIVVTRRNAHRLLLAGLRVAMKALEDQSYPHVRFARVGGVSERELARLEISFCFLTGFELTVNVALLTQHWELLRRGTDCWNAFDVARLERPFQLGKPPPRNDVKAQA